MKILLFFDNPEKEFKNFKKFLLSIKIDNEYDKKIINDFLKAGSVSDVSYEDVIDFINDYNLYFKKFKE